MLCADEVNPGVHKLLITSSVSESNNTVFLRKLRHLKDIIIIYEEYINIISSTLVLFAAVKSLNTLLIWLARKLFMLGLNNI